MSSLRVLVLGQTGFIGKKLVDKLVTLNNIELISLKEKILIQNEQIINEIEKLKPQVIIIAVGKSFVPDSWVNPVEFFNVNTSGTLNCCEAARRVNAKIIFLSTFVYNHPFHLPINEGNQVAPLNPYAASKIEAEHLLKYYYDFFGVESNVLRLFNVYGQHQHKDFLIPFLIEQIKNGNTIQVKDLKPKRDYIHVDDVIEAIVAALKFNGHKIYNVGSGESYSVLEIIEKLISISGKKLEIISTNESRPNEVMDTRADITKIALELKWTPKISINQGLKNLYA